MNVRLAIAGAGSRGADVYAQHAGLSPYDVKFVAVAEPRAAWREKAIRQFHIPRENAFETWEELAAQPRLADGVLVTMQDQMHAAPAQAFMRRGYHVMLEKPMGTTEEDCRAVVATQQETGRILAVCHVMRYSLYAQTMKTLLESGLIGDIASIHHVEPIGYWHFAHSYVRGSWRRENDSSSALLAKCCHDLDILRHWMGRSCFRVSSFGSLMHFRKECQPKGAADRCLDCPQPIESGCPYSAIKCYLRDRRSLFDWPNNVLTTDTSPEGITQALREGPYGRCVYACDNDVLDHQVVNMEFDGGATAVLTMASSTVAQARETWVMGTKGQLRGNMATIRHFNFLNDREETHDIKDIGKASVATAHAGDSAIILSFIKAIAENNPSILLTDPQVSLESHLMAFAAERSRKNGKAEEVCSDPMKVGCIPI
jgi:predicted dehydrogenase